MLVAGSKSYGNPGQVGDCPNATDRHFPEDGGAVSSWAVAQSVEIKIIVDLKNEATFSANINLKRAEVEVGDDVQPLQVTGVAVALDRVVVQQQPQDKVDRQRLKR